MSKSDVLLDFIKQANRQQIHSYLFLQMRKKVDQRIQILMENCIKLRQRGFFIIVGDRGKEQVVNIHYLLNKMNFKTKPSVLWCYKKELGFSSNKQKRLKEIKKLQKKGLFDSNVDDPFQLFVTSTEIRYCYYKDTHKILGQTHQMLILQDFEAITPNMLCRTVETVEGGGFVIMLFKTMSSLKQLYTLTMDAHNRFRYFSNLFFGCFNLYPYKRTDQFSEIEPRFNERFIMSLSRSENTIVMDDELNILPISSLIENIKPTTAEGSLNSKMVSELDELKESLKSNQIVGPLVSIAKTLDQARAIMTFIDAITEKSTRSTISLTAGRGRGKSAAIGVAIAAAVSCGFSNIYVTAPSPENLKTVFEFIFNGLEQQAYKENMHYDTIQSTNPEFNNAVIRVNIFKTHKQIIQYVAPTDFASIGHADLVVIDEAAAIPLIYVKQFLGPYTVFLSSTINGYEGTGRSLSLKLIQQLKNQNKGAQNQSESKDGTAPTQASQNSRTLKELTLNDPIRYSPNDPIEAWLNGLLCLEATQAVSLKNDLPSPNDCELFMVNRDTLFSYKKSTESFLFNLMSLFISSHYKNSPNDLQLLSDAPSHAIFVLMGRIKQGEKKADMPDILCAVQVALEGKISKETFNSSSERGAKPAGDLIPWTISEQFQDREFPSLAGARVVRIATHPAATKMGYGTKTLELLSQFYQGQLIDLSKENIVRENYLATTTRNAEGEKKLKPLLKRLTEIDPPKLNYLGVAFGLSKELFKFWKKCGYSPLYLRQVKNDLTAEHSCIMVKPLKRTEEEAISTPIEQGKDQFNKDWIESYSEDFKKRFLSLLSNEFREVDVQMSLGIIDPVFATEEGDKLGLPKKNANQTKLFRNKEQLENFVSLSDLKRLEAFQKKNVSLNLIIDLLPGISKQLFLNKFDLQLSLSQCAIFLGLGLQHKTVERLARELSIPITSIFGLFNKGIRKVTSFLNSIYEKSNALEVESDIGDEIQDSIEEEDKQEESNKKPDTTKVTKLNKKRPANHKLTSEDINDQETESNNTKSSQKKEQANAVGKKGLLNNKAKKLKPN